MWCMSRELVHIYGPFSIQSFGLIITVGLLLFTWLVRRHPLRKKLLNDEQFSTVILLGVVSGIIGGRLLYVAQEYGSMKNIWEAFHFWEGGFSILGTIIAVLGTIGFYLKKINVPMLPFLDMITMYAPLLQSISRLGCFFAGCCYGLPTSLPWAITYTDANAAAPLCTALHPTQLYSSLLLFCIFLFLRFKATKFHLKAGQLTMLYLMLASFERFIVGFWRADRAYFKLTTLEMLSIHQWLALGIFVAAFFAFIGIKVGSKAHRT